MKKEKGKIYTNSTKDLVIMCTKKSNDINFQGVVLYNGGVSVPVGCISDSWVSTNFTEKIGPISLNNVTINN